MVSWGKNHLYTPESKKGTSLPSPFPLSALSWRCFSGLEAFPGDGGTWQTQLLRFFTLWPTMLLLCHKIFFSPSKKKNSFFICFWMSPNGSLEPGWGSVCRWPGLLVRVQLQTLLIYLEQRSQNCPEFGSRALTLTWCLASSSLCLTLSIRGWSLLWTWLHAV